MSDQIPGVHTVQRRVKRRNHDYRILRVQVIVEEARQPVRAHSKTKALELAMQNDELDQLTFGGETLEESYLKVELIPRKERNP